MEDEYRTLQARYQSLELKYAELLVEHTKTKKQLRCQEKQIALRDKISALEYTTSIMAESPIKNRFLLQLEDCQRELIEKTSL